MNPFEPHIPSVFVIASPFQALCAMAAIKQLQITNFMFIAFIPSDDPRSKQIENFFNEAAIKYVPIRKFTRLVWLYYKIKALKHRDNQYKRLFLGDFRGIILSIIGSCYVSDNSEVVYLDDGNVTISILNNLISEPMNDINRVRLERVSNRRGFIFQKKWLTIYGDISNPNFIIKNLDLSFAVQKNNLASTKGYIYIVGTNIERFCDALKISQSIFVSRLESLFCQIKNEYPNTPIVYIPHGRDNSEYAIKLCQKYECTFHRAEIMIELELLHQKSNPLAIYGFTSTALYNLKKIYPESQVVNVLFECCDDNIAFQEYKMLSEYYQKNGIELIMERFSNGAQE